MKKILLTLLLTSTTTLHAALPSHYFDEKAHDILNKHYHQYQDAEYFSGISLSIYMPNLPILNYYTGNVSHDDNSAPITANTLFQIGSITKSFTSAIMLQLETEGKLKLNDTLQTWLPEYDKWSAVPLEQLLNMSSGLPNYSDSPLWITEDYRHADHVWTKEELIKAVYPRGRFSPPLKSGYFYSNTGYILAELIIEKVTQQDFEDELFERTIKPAHLSNTFYPVPTPDKDIQTRMAHGYNFNQYDNPLLVGADVTHRNLSWAAAAGGMVSTSEDIIKWVQALFLSDAVLNKNQKQKMQHMISLATGKSLYETSIRDPRGFGLGVSQIKSDDSKIGRFWFYEGETLGFRAMYMYTLCNGVIISSIFNSATNSENDHSKDLMQAIYNLVVEQNPKLRC